MRNIINWIYLRIAPDRLLKYVSTDIERRAFFIREYQQMVHRMWRGEFVGAKKKEIREGIRREYDKINEDLEALRVASEKEGTSAEAKESLRKLMDNKERDIAQLKEQIDGLDKEVSDLNELLAGYREGLDLLKGLINE
mgnify:CR=1 FL=1